MQGALGAVARPCASGGAREGRCPVGHTKLEMVLKMKNDDIVITATTQAS